MVTICIFDGVTYIFICIAGISLIFKDLDIVNVIIIYMKKLLDSDWLRAVQFRCNTRANYTPIFWIMIG